LPLEGVELCQGGLYGMHARLARLARRRERARGTSAYLGEQRGDLSLEQASALHHAIFDVVLYPRRVQIQKASEKSVGRSLERRPDTEQAERYVEQQPERGSWLRDVNELVEVEARSRSEAALTTRRSCELD
jgi:hypothetical protein